MIMFDAGFWSVWELAYATVKLSCAFLFDILGDVYFIQ